MKSRTLFFNVTALRKNLTRFAPAWALYGLLMLLLILDGRHMSNPGFADAMGRAIGTMAVGNLFYALLCAQLLFGDLYNSRMCNALHAMPMRREGWFLTNVTSGLLFSLIPNAVVSLVAMLMCGKFAVIPLLWLGGATLGFLFFFGVATLSAYLVGNRFAMALVYIILNGFSLILYWLMYSIFEPMLYGVTVKLEWFGNFCPVVYLSNLRFVEIYGSNIDAAWRFSTGWGYLGICAGVGVVAFGLALLCYRKRNLETAGDFVAVKPVGPIFLLLYTICGGACCHGFFSVFVGDENEFFLFLGLAIGFFTGMMLLKRTVKVFKLKTFLGFGAVVLAMILSMVMVRTDLFDIVGWMPKAEEIQSVSITTEGTSNFRNNTLVLTEEEDLEKILQIHQYGLQNRDAGIDGRRDARVILTYTLKNGIVRERKYSVNIGTACGDMIRQYISHPSIVLGTVYDLLDTHTITGVTIEEQGRFVVNEEALQQLMDAIMADCAEGNLAQDWAFTDGLGEYNWLTVEFHSETGQRLYTDLRFTPAAKHLSTWLAIQTAGKAQAGS